jgi:DGQHR domain-containing protein
MGPNQLSVRALRTHQGDDIDVYAFFIRGADILKIADISRIHRDEQEHLKGFQRREVQNHVKGIADYLDKGKVLFPNAIILALSPEVDFKQSRGPTPEGLSEVSHIGTLSIPLHQEGRRVAWVVDGQQRSLALGRTENKDIPVPVIGFVAADLDTQRQQFILVNKAKPLPVRLINELLPEIAADLPPDLSPRKIPSELCNLLNTDPKSPFYHLIKRASDEDSRSSAVIQDTALINLMKISINNYGALSLFKNTAAGRSDTDAMYRVMCTYWTAVKEVFPDAWGKPPQESRLMHAAGIQSMGILMDRIMPRVYQSQNAATEVQRALKRIAPHCCWTEGTWEGLGLRWNDVQAVHRHIKMLAEHLVQLDFAATQEAA